MSDRTTSRFVITREQLDAMVAHARACMPEEACGLLVGTATGDDAATVTRFVPMANTARSPVIYLLDPKEHLRAELAAEADGLEVVGVMHSHTHSEPYPSTTDVLQAPDPGWHYLIVSLKRGLPETRSYRIRGGTVAEEDITLA